MATSIMKSKKYAAVGYAFYLLSYLGFVLMSANASGFNMSAGAVINVLTFVLLPVILCVVVGVVIWCFKRTNIWSLIFVAMSFIAPIGVLINLLATYLLWWSSNNA